MWRGGCRSNISVAASFVWRCLSGSTMTRFHIPLIEPDMQISRIRLADKTSRLHPRHVVPKGYEAEAQRGGNGVKPGGQGANPSPSRGSGGPRGDRNGRFRHGLYTRENETIRRSMRAKVREIK